VIQTFWIEPTGESRVRKTEHGSCSERLYAFPGGVTGALREAPVGAMWDASWNPAEWKGEDGISLMVKTPGGEWFVDGRASNCTAPGDWTEEGPDGGIFCKRPTHRCWVRHGDPRAGRITVDKNGTTCAAGAGSIQCGSYHGFLKDGHLT
jgi:hypothetical protein